MKEIKLIQYNLPDNTSVYTKRRQFSITLAWDGQTKYFHSKIKCWHR